MRNTSKDNLELLINGEPMCVYCGENIGKTRDHVVPRCLFGDNPPANLITVPACHECNNRKSKNDDYLRDMLMIDFRTGRSEIAQKILREKVYSSVKRNRSRVARSAINDGKKVSLFTSSGIYYGDFIEFSLEEQRLNEIFFMIMQGLYSKVVGKYLPSNCDFQGYILDSSLFQKHYEMMVNINANGPYMLGNVFGCLFVYAEEDPTKSIWLIWFYEGICFIVTSNYDLPSGDKS